MNNTPAPFTRDEVIELLSAELDGEFDAAAADLGLTPEEARARLDATPGAADDRRALTEAAGIRIPDLDDARRSELVARAMQHASTDELSARRTRRWDAQKIMTIAAMFAAIVLAVGAFATMSGSDDEGGDDAAMVAEEMTEGDARDDAADESDDAGIASDGDASTESGAGLGETQAPAADALVQLYDFGDVTDPDALRSRLTAVYSYRSTSPFETSPLEACSECSIPALPQTSTFDEFQIRDVCAPDVEAAYGVAGPPVYIGAGTYDGEPVAVTVYATDDGVQAFVIGADCSVLHTQTVRP
jgi:hypothetical protein